MIASASSGRGGAWGPDNLILFVPDITNTIWRVNPDGTGLARQTTFVAERGDTSHRWPQFLADGRHFVFFARSSQAANEGVYLGAIDSPEATLLVESSSGAVSTSNGQLLLYDVDGTLMARFIDVSNARLSGEPIPVAEAVAGSSSFYGAFSASKPGVIAYASGASQAEVDWFDRSGTKRAVAAARSRYVDFQLSPDARYIALAEAEPHTDRPDIEILDLLRGSKRRLTFSRATDASPVWSPEGPPLCSDPIVIGCTICIVMHRTAPETTNYSFIRQPISDRWAPDGLYRLPRGQQSRMVYLDGAGISSRRAAAARASRVRWGSRAGVTRRPVAGLHVVQDQSQT